MPFLPSSQCDHFQCKAPSIKGSRFCDAHTPAKKLSTDRQAFNAQYKLAIWEKIRAKQLSANPLCAACLIDGRITQANHVDHLFAWAAIGPAAFTRNIFQSLCSQHHGIKSGLEKKGIFRHYRQRPIDYALDDYEKAINEV